MYSYVNSVLRASGKNQGFKEVDISLMLLGEVYKKYVDGYIVVNNPTLSPNPIYVNLALLKRSSVLFYNLAFETWLSAINNTILPTYTTPPVYTRKDILFADARQARYDIQVYNGTDASLYKENIDYDLMATGLLSTVNGFFHINHSIEETLIVKDAAKSMRMANSSHIGLVNFAALGVLSQHPITVDMIGSLASNIPLKQSVLLETGFDLNNKTVMVSIGGYLHVADRVIDVLNSDLGLIRLNMEYLSLARRYMEMKDNIDLSSLGLSTGYGKTHAVNVAELESDSTITAILLLSQSFICILDAPIVTVESITTAIPHTALHHEFPVEPKYPLLSPSGRVIEYWSSNQRGRWILSTSPVVYRNFNYETTEWGINRAITNTADTEPVNLVSGRLMRISSHVLMT